MKFCRQISYLKINLKTNKHFNTPISRWQQSTLKCSCNSGHFGQSLQLQKGGFPPFFLTPKLLHIFGNHKFIIFSTMQNIKLYYCMFFFKSLVLSAVDSSFWFILYSLIIHVTFTLNRKHIFLKIWFKFVQSLALIKIQQRLFFLHQTVNDIHWIGTCLQTQTSLH